MTAITYHERGYEAGPSDPLDGLMSAYFERTFTVLNGFVDDPRHCLELTEEVFRSVSQSRNANVQGIYSTLVKMVRALHHKAILLEGVSHESVLCWLIKETSPLTYEDMAGVMGLTRDDVKRNIAEVRYRLIG